MVRMVRGQFKAFQTGLKCPRHWSMTSNNPMVTVSAGVHPNFPGVPRAVKARIGQLILVWEVAGRCTQQAGTSQVPLHGHRVPFFYASTSLERIDFIHIAVDTISLAKNWQLRVFGF